MFTQEKIGFGAGGKPEVRFGCVEASYLRVLQRSGGNSNRPMEGCVICSSSQTVMCRSVLPSGPSLVTE